MNLQSRMPRFTFKDGSWYPFNPTDHVAGFEWMNQNPVRFNDSSGSNPIYLGQPGYNDALYEEVFILESSSPSEQHAS